MARIPHAEKLTVALCGVCFEYTEDLKEVGRGCREECWTGRFRVPLMRKRRVWRCKICPTIPPARRSFAIRSVLERDNIETSVNTFLSYREYQTHYEQSHFPMAIRQE